MPARYTAIVVGGGFYGCFLALHLARSGGRVLVLEAENDLFRRASYKNQARIHNGYHYPRDRMTALRSHHNFQRFIEEHDHDGVVVRCGSYYAISRELSKVSARSFMTLFERIGVPLDVAPPRIRRLFSASMVEEVFAVQEYVFDAFRLRDLIRQRLERSGVEARLGESVRHVASGTDGALTVSTPGREYTALDVYNCTYSGLNQVLRDSGLPEVPLKHEMAEVALIRSPAVLDGVGITVMCGPFFSCIPFPTRGLHSLTHVSFTPQFSWTEGMGDTSHAAIGRDLLGQPRVTTVARMVEHASRFVPVLAESRYVDSLWELKTVLPRNEENDGRPILFRSDCGLPGLHCVLGAKIDNIYDLLDEVDTAAATRRRE